MLNSIRIEGFRKYNNTVIEGFGGFNFILGDNNVGKTSVLEAVYAWACGQNIIPFLSIPLARGRYAGIQQPYWLMEEILAVVNNRKDLPLKMALEGDDDGVAVRYQHTIYPSEVLTEYDSTYKNMQESVVPRTNAGALINPLMQSMLSMASPVIIAKWEIERDGKIQTATITSPFTQAVDVKSYHMAKYIDVLSQTAISESVQIYASLKREERLDEVVEMIRDIFPEVDRIDMIPYPDGSQAPLSVRKKNGTILPMYAYGDGLQRWFYILGAIALYKNSIICIDEIDTGIHPAAQKAFCSGLLKYAEINHVQLFVTTHNTVFLDAFIHAAMDMEAVVSDRIRVYTMKEAKEDVLFRCLDIREAFKARDKYNMELM